MAKNLDLKKSSKGLSFFIRRLNIFGSKQRQGDQSIFDRRGAITITDKEITKKNGEIVKIRSIADAGPSNSMAITRPPTSGNTIDISKAMDAFNNWVYTCTKAIADEIAGIEFRVFSTKKHGGAEEMESHELLDLLEAVNPMQTGPEFRYTLATHLELTGNAYILLEGVTTEKSKPNAIYLLNPSKVKVMLNKVTFPFQVIGYEYSFDTRAKTFKPYEIIHLKYVDPSNPYIGMGTVQGIAGWIDNDNSSTSFLSKFFRNGAQIGMTFETDMTSEEQLQELKDSFEEQHAGVDNAYKGLFLPKGVKRPSTGEKFSEMGFDTISNTSRDKILAGFRVSKTILGAAESETNRATAETADYVFAKRTIKPKMLLITSYLNEFLVPRYGKDIFLTFSDPVPESADEKSTQMKNAVTNLPTMTVNEARKMYLDMEEIEGGDKLLVPNTYVPAVDAGKVSPYMGLGGPGENGKVKTNTFKPLRRKVGWMPIIRDKGETQAFRNAEARKTLSDDLAAKIKEVLGQAKKKSVGEMTDAEYTEVVLKSKLERIGKYGREMKHALIKINEAQEKEVLANLAQETKSLKSKEKAIDDLFNLGKWITITVNALTPIAQDQFTKEANIALEVINEPGLDVENTPSAQEAIDKAMNLMARSYNEDTVAILKEKITEGLELGYGVEKMGELVKDIYQWKNTIAAERVALTESNRITNTAGKIAWKESGVVRELKWVTSQNDVCSYCQAQEGKTISIDDDFFKKGDEIKGTDGEVIYANYSDIGGPPLHPNCHCGIRPVAITTIEAAADPEKEKKLDEMDEALEEAIIDTSLKALEEQNGKN